MSIIVVVDAERRPERGWEDPGHPIATWLVAGRVTGNVSGGGMSVQVNLNSIGTQRGLAYSLEHLMARDSRATAVNLKLLVSNLEPIFIAVPVTRLYGFPMIAIGGTSTEIVFEHKRAGLGLFMGIAATISSISALTFQLDNADGETLEITCAGYIWGPRSVVQLPGGYRRPLDGMFG